MTDLRLPALLSLVLLAGAAPSAAQGPATPHDDLARPSVVVTGEGEASAVPDLAITTLTVLRTAETAAAALEDANRAAADVAAAMREAGIESRDLQTGGFSIAPQYRYENRPDGTSVPPEIVGYEVRNTITVRVRDLGGLGGLLDRAVSLGVNQGGDIAFSIEDPSALENEARTMAVARARASAEVLAEAAGRELGPVVFIADEAAASFPPRPMAMEARMMAAPAPDAVPVEIGENRVTARVRMVYELGPEMP